MKLIKYEEFMKAANAVGKFHYVLRMCNDNNIGLVISSDDLTTLSHTGMTNYFDLILSADSHSSVLRGVKNRHNVDINFTTLEFITASRLMDIIHRDKYSTANGTLSHNLNAVPDEIPQEAVKYTNFDKIKSYKRPEQIAELLYIEIKSKDKNNRVHTYYQGLDNEQYNTLTDMLKGVTNWLNEETDDYIEEKKEDIKVSKLRLAIEELGHIIKEGEELSNSTETAWYSSALNTLLDKIR